ncbi:MAG: class I SAM-dependent methyltransferase [Pseudomonadota bacterium]|nr:class I SAM-dependent methyltransferase [Pseudomonadota bacterium]
MPGILLRSLTSEFGDGVFYVDYGRRHWVRASAWLARNGFSWADVIDVAPNILYGFANGGAAPLRVAEDLEGLGGTATSTDLREIAAAGLRGIGMEFGSGASPFPVPLRCHMLYADAYSFDTLRANMYPGQTHQQMVRPDFVTNLQTLKGVADESLDFIVACHVIEHTVSPITALKSCWRALKPGGDLILVVPDMRKTFDHARESTSLQHLIEDYRAPSRERDWHHFMEFYTKAFNVNVDADIDTFISAKQDAGADIHYHCWTYESFSEMVAWVAENGAAWSQVWSHPTLSGGGSDEFYFRLTK